MNISFVGRVRSLLATGMILLGSASCVNIDESLGENFIPHDQIWDVYPCDNVTLTDITMKPARNMSGYSTRRFTFGAVKDQRFTTSKSTSFTLVPLMDTLDFGKKVNGYPKVTQFHLTAIRDTVSMVFDNQERILQNVYVNSLREPVDSTSLYADDPKFQIKEGYITKGIPIYDGGDSLSFDFREEYALAVIEGIEEFQKLDGEKRDSLKCYIEKVPGIVISTDEQTEIGGRINMFNLTIQTESGYVTGNYAELKFQGIYEGSDEPVDTSFLFFFGPSDFLKDDDTTYPAQYAFNAGTHTSTENVTDQKECIYVEGGSGLKPVISAIEIKRIVSELVEAEIAAGKDIDISTVVINKATIVLPYNVGGDYDKLNRYPAMLSPTVVLSGETGEGETYYTFAGLTDSSIESENHGDINRSLNMYCPDITHHVQEIANLTPEEGEDEASFKERVGKYDVWMLIMHEEITETSTDTGYDDYYNNLLYNSYYNNMMYDPYGYGYGYGYGGYGYGGYGGYGYDNYYNYYMMAAYASASSSSSTSSSSLELDKDRYYDAVLNGPEYNGSKPSLKITFSALKNPKE